MIYPNLDIIRHLDNHRKRTNIYFLPLLAEL